MEVTRVSEDLFGRGCRLPLALWILNHPKERIFQSEPPDHLGGRTAIRQELARFARIGLLDEERPDGESRVYYVRTGSPLWEVIRVAGEASRHGA